MPIQECPVAGCPKGRGDKQLMCKRHWYMVPKELRDRVWATARKMWADDPDTDTAYRNWSEAKDAAVAYVEQVEATG